MSYGRWGGGDGRLATGGLAEGLWGARGRRFGGAGQHSEVAPGLVEGVGAHGLKPCVEIDGEGWIEGAVVVDGKSGRSRRKP